MHESESWRAAEGDDHRVDHSVKGGIGGRERLIHHRSALEVVRVVLTPVPGDPGALGVVPVQAPHPCPFASAQLLQAELRDVLALEAHEVHLAGDGEAQRGVADGLGLRL